MAIQQKKAAQKTVPLPTLDDILSAIHAGQKPTALKDKVEVHVAEVVRHGTEIIVPETMSLQQAQDVLKQRAEYEETEVDFKEAIPVLPWDGALALQRVMEREFGWAQQKTIEFKSFFGTQKIKPQMISVEVAYGKTALVPWGQFAIPNVDATLTTSSRYEKDVFVFELQITGKRKHEQFLRNFVEKVRHEAQKHSIYRGKAVKVKFRNDDFDLLEMPQISFMDVTGVTRESAVYSRDIERRLERDLYVPITRAADMLANDVPIKTGVLLTGTYGTGKTLAATVASKLATDSGLLYVYVQDPRELPDAVNFARQYQSPAAVVFVEDVDRVTGGDRNRFMDTILNTIDGVDGKTSNIIVVVTTNDLESINPAMIRPGRLDSIIEVTPPDAEAAERLVRRFAGDQLREGEDLAAVGQRLAGAIPAVIVEVVKRAKRAEIALLPPGAKVTHLTAQGLLDAADSIQNQVEILKRATDKELPSKGEVLASLLSDVVGGYGSPDADFEWDGITNRTFGSIEQ